MQIKNKDKDLINPAENQRKSLSPVAPLLFSCPPCKLSVEAVSCSFPLRCVLWLALNYRHLQRQQLCKLGQVKYLECSVFKCRLDCYWSAAMTHTKWNERNHSGTLSLSLSPKLHIPTLAKAIKKQHNNCNNFTYGLVVSVIALGRTELINWNCNSWSCRPRLWSAACH